jgi:hypothetical protein
VVRGERREADRAGEEEAKPLQYLQVVRASPVPAGPRHPTAAALAAPCPELARRRDFHLPTLQTGSVQLLRTAVILPND